ncbi:MAG: glycosyltransferase family 4 protein [Anaerolineales bacterium]|nr:glycosyltransferase family 4 protein [Anaerolineales bacterium]
MEGKLNRTNHIGFISTRLSGTDGVSLEVVKWVNVLSGMGHECFYFAGESEWPDERSYLVSEAHFQHPDIAKINRELVDQYVRKSDITLEVEKLQDLLKDHLHRFVNQFELDVLIVENALSLPMNIPLGLALTQFIAETEIPIIAHHHDFHWERSRYVVTAADDYLQTAFPPTLRTIHHIVINSYAGRQLALRTGVSSILIPNVMNFDEQPPKPDEYADDMRSELGIPEDDFLLIQPTRIVPRKRIEKAIELTRRIELDCSLVITHESGDEGHLYETYLRDFSEIVRGKVHFASDRFSLNRSRTKDGKKIYSLADAYQNANLVTYPSTIEGFGNALLEAIYYKSPIVMNNYEIFKTDILPKGFKIIGFNDFIDPKCIEDSYEILTNREKAAEMVEYNFNVAKKHYSYHILENRLVALLDECMGLE